MRKFISIVVALSLGLMVMAQTSFYVHQGDKAYEFTISKTDSIDFVAPNNYVKASQLDALTPQWAYNGAIKAGFSISATEQVYFSQGNLQYQASTGTWRFAEKQYDILEADNSNISSSNSGWIDLFGWGTSGWNSGSAAYQPYSTSARYSDYYPGGDYTNNLTGSYANADWGVYNKISNGGKEAGHWRTLTYDEWDSLLNNATMASAQVNGVNGMVLLPDNWALPTGLTFTAGMSEFSEFTDNIYATEQWTKMEAAGAVFLPAGGSRSQTYFDFMAGFLGDYLSSSSYENREAGSLSLYSGWAYMSRFDRSKGLSVRLVQDVK